VSGPTCGGEKWQLARAREADRRKQTAGFTAIPIKLVVPNIGQRGKNEEELIERRRGGRGKGGERRNRVPDEDREKQNGGGRKR